MGIEIQKNLVGGNVREWILPNFSTTKENDTIVGSVIMMGAFQKYFEYKFSLMCGLPEVTLLGEVEDYIKLKEKVSDLKKYDAGDKLMIKLTDLLLPICDELIDSAKGKPNLDFWGKICHYISGGSGPSYLSGWICAFCSINPDGKWLPKEYKNSIYGKIDTDDVPCAYITVPVVVDDNGTIYNTTMFAGSFATTLLTPTKVQPRHDWALAL